MKNLLLSLLILFSLFGCISEWDRKLDEIPIDTELLGTTSFFSAKNVQLKIREYNKILTISLDYKLLKEMKLPVDSFYGDTLTQTRFFLKLFCEGKPVRVNTKVIGYKGFSVTSSDTNYIIIQFKKQNILPVYHDEVELPLTVFHTLKTGKHNFEGELFITSFYGSHYDTTSNESIELETPFNGIKGKIKFKINIPEIYMTTIYSEGLKLRNDDKFSPIGMDFSFRLGYPDIFWEIFYPAYEEKDFSFPYWRSHEENYATDYLDKDTIYLYHFSPKDEFKIGVYDRDDLSGDDFLGDWLGSIKELESESLKTLQFDNLKWFKIKVKQQGCINKK